jgi:hypothetical protein
MLTPIRQPDAVLSVLVPLSQTTGKLVPPDLDYPLDGIEPPQQITQVSPITVARGLGCGWSPNDRYFSSLNDLNVVAA